MVLFNEIRKLLENVLQKYFANAVCWQTFSYI